MSSGLAGSVNPDGNQSPTCPRTCLRTCREGVRGNEGAWAWEAAEGEWAQGAGTQGRSCGGARRVSTGRQPGTALEPREARPRLGRGFGGPDTARHCAVTVCGTHSRVHREVQDSGSDVKVTPCLVPRLLVGYADAL